jgi:hypothetical protein
MFLRLLANGAIVDQGPGGHRCSSLVEEDCRVYKISIGIFVPDPQFGYLACGTGNIVLMALGAGGCIKDRSEAVGGIVHPFELLLICHESISGRLCKAITDRLRCGALGQRGSSKSCRSFSRSFLRDQRQTRD